MYCHGPASMWYVRCCMPCARLVCHARGPAGWQCVPLSMRLLAAAAALRVSLWGCPGMCFTRSNPGLLGYFQGYLGGGALVVLGYMFREIRIQPSTVGPRTPWEAARCPDGGAGERWPCVISLFNRGDLLEQLSIAARGPPGADNGT